MKDKRQQQTALPAELVNIQHPVGALMTIATSYITCISLLNQFSQKKSQMSSLLFWYKVDVLHYWYELVKQVLRQAGIDEPIKLRSLLNENLRTT